MLAIISDIHSNLEALTAVLADIDRHGAREIWCLGDVVGYGPQPIEVADLVRARATRCVEGNHDEALRTGGYGFNPPAMRAIDWTREQLEPGFFSGMSVRERWQWLAELPETLAVGPDLLVHGSPLDPTSDYMLPAEAGSPFHAGKYDQIFATFERRLYCGHSHLPCVITEDRRVIIPAEVGNRWTHSSGKAIVNVGSVGQPRDGDPRACYVLVDGDAIEWRRIPYDFEATAAKIRKIERLAEKFADRLKVGA